MSIKRGYICDSRGQITRCWRWAIDDPPSPYPDNLTLSDGDVVIEDTETSAEDWEVFEQNLHKYYVNDGVRVAKPEMSLTLDTDTVPADGETLATISGIPAGTAAIVGDQLLIVDDGILEMSFNLSGDYEVILSHPRYLSPNPAPVIHATGL